MTAVAPQDEFICFLDAASSQQFSLRAGNLTTVVVETRHPAVQAASHEGRRSIRDVLAMTRAASRHRLDAFFFPSVYTWFPLFPSVHAVVTIHDAIAERFPELTVPTRRARFFWGLKVRLALMQSRGVLTVSEFSARDIARVLGVAPARIAIASEAPASAFKPSDDPKDIDRIAHKYGLPENASWFIYVGGFNPHKNVTDIVRSHARLAAEIGGDAPYLVLVGTRDADVFQGEMPEIEKTVREAGHERLVIWTGFVPDQELRHLNSGAIALVLPSDAEGFGLPAIEAAACGTPSIATTESPLPNLLRGGGVFIAPRDQAALLDAMRTLATDPDRRSALGAVALARSRELEWESGARAAVAAIRRAAA